MRSVFFCKDMGALPAASFFAFLAFVLYGIDTYFSFAVWQAERRARTTVANAQTNGQPTTRA